jgi:hypothetical protein
VCKIAKLNEWCVKTATSNKIIFNGKVLKFEKNCDTKEEEGCRRGVGDKV